MSFAGGADCSTTNNALSQFSKHTQQDRSLQRSNIQQNFSQKSGIKNPSMMNQMDRENMERFFSNGPQQTSQSAFHFQPMRHELNMVHQQSSSQNNSWSTEFQSHSPTPINAINSPVAINGAQHMMGSSKWSAEFQNLSPGPSMLEQPSQHRMNMSMRGSYQPMFAPTMGMGMNMGMAQSNTQHKEEVKNDGVIEWEDQFKQIEDSLSNTQIDAEASETKEQSPEIIIDDKYNATFEEVWDNLNSEALEEEFINNQYEPPSWEKDFATYASTRAHYGEYKYEKENQFLELDDPYAIGIQLMESGAKLSEAALAFEAAIQKDESHIDAWLRLGEVQTQNEKEIAGISALEKCLQLDPKNLSALMTLAVSYINEGYDNAAFATLERWIETKYPQVAEKARLNNPKINDEDRFTLNKRVTELFIQAAQLSPNHANMDADVQMGLGVLFYANEDFDKTIDCFKAALQVNPDDALLWNRLGASLANSNRSEEAVDAYFKALQLKPAFVRARYNLGVSCINIGCYKEAVEHLLGALSMHRVEGMEDDDNLANQSTSLLETLKRAFIAMDRRDLLEYVKPGMHLKQFRGEFTF